MSVTIGQSSLEIVLFSKKVFTSWFSCCFEGYWITQKSPQSGRNTPGPTSAFHCVVYTVDQLHVVGIYHFLKAHNFPEFLGYVI